MFDATSGDICHDWLFLVRCCYYNIATHRKLQVMGISLLYI